MTGLGFSKGVSTVKSEEQGMSLDGNVFYQTKEKYDSEVITFETDIYFPEGFSGNGGVIMGNYSGDCPACNFEINASGNPIIYVDSGSGMSWKKTTYEFNEVNIYEYNGEQVNLTIVKDIANKKAHCYINGVLKQTLNYTNSAMVPRMETVIGSDKLFNVGRQYFLGYIRSIRLYSDVRSATEVASDYNGKPGTDNLLASYDFTKVTNQETIKDSGSKGYDLERVVMYMDEGPVIDDYDYSFTIVGDPQVLVEEWLSQHPLHNIYDYILDNAKGRKTKFVITVGDYVTWDGDAAWKETTEQLQRLDGVLPYNIVRGNHDGNAQLNKYLPWSHYWKICGGSYNGQINNTWQELTAGNLDYLILNLDYGAADYILDWASEVIEAHPNHNVIVVTHSYLSRDNQLGDETYACPPSQSGGYNNGVDVWQKIIKKHSNIVMVISGHDGSAEIRMRQDVGDNGNIVTQMLVNGQNVDAYTSGGVGLVATLYFSEGGSKVQVEYYSTIKDKWYMNTNQFTMNVDVVERSSDTTSDGGTQEKDEKSSE